MSFVDKTLFDKYLEANFETIQEAFRDNPHHQLIPSLMICTLNDNEDGWNIDLAVFEEFDENRYDLLGGLGVKYGQDQKPVVAAYLVSEVWVSVQDPRERAAHPDNCIAPSEDPDRKEAVIVCGMTLDLHTKMMVAIIEREQGKATLQLEDRQASLVESPLLKQFFRYFAMAYFLSKEA